MRLPGDSEARIAVMIVILAFVLGAIVLLLPAMANPLVLVHTVDGRDVVVNGEHIVSITKPRNLGTDDANCLISLVDGKFLTVDESCREVILKLQHEDANEK